MATPLIDRREQMFPTLTEAQVARIAVFGTSRDVRAGEVLYECGEQNTRFFVVVRGAVDVVRPVGDREERVTVHGPGEFTGEANMLSAQRSLVRGRVAEDGAVIVVDRDDLRAIVQHDAELSEILMRAFILRRAGLLAQVSDELILLGSRHSAATLRLKEFLTRNAQPFSYRDVESEPAVQALLDRFQIGVHEVPVIVCRGGHVLRNPSVESLASALGLSPKLDGKVVRDVVVVGAGPAGLAAAVYGASEGLDVLVLESIAPGGQAGTSSRIENYLGFPTGVSGQELADRALMQAEKFRAEVAIARTAVRLDCDSRPYTIHLEGGGLVHTRAIVVATGARYRRLALPELGQYEGTGVFYSATYLEARMCENEEVAIVGGGNSAGQAAVFLAGMAKHVHVLVRAKGLVETMSRYLIDRIEGTRNITLRTQSEIIRLEGDGHLERICWRRSDTRAEDTRPIGNLFLMTGADPNTGWLEGCVVLDDKNFVKAGADLLPDELLTARWPLARRPYLLESSIPGVFVVGDARSSSVKRVAAAVGEGSICIQLVHRALQEL